jgi:hypothetical protein
LHLFTAQFVVIHPQHFDVNIKVNQHDTSAGSGNILGFL